MSLVNLFVMLLVDCQLSLDVIGWETVIGAFWSVCRSKVCTCIVEYVGQYCESKSVCGLSVDVVDESFVGCEKL